MARTIEQIYNSLIQAKETAPSPLPLTPTGTANYQNTLAELNSNSRVARWRLLLFIFAIGIWTLENFIHLFKTEIDKKIMATSAGTIPWFIEKAKAFQLNYTLSIDSTYNPIYTDTTSNAALQSKIVKHAAAEINNRLLIIKVSKDNNNTPTPLTNAEVNQFRAYIIQIQPAGIPIRIISKPADRIFLQIIIYHNALISSTQVITDASNALNNYFKNLPYNGKISIQSIIDTIQQIFSVSDVKLIEATGKSYSPSNLLESQLTFYSLAESVNTLNYTPTSGIAILDTNSIITAQAQ